MENNTIKTIGFKELISTLPESRNEALKAVWNAALQYAAENARIESIDDFTNEIVEPRLENFELMDETYRVSKESILDGLVP